MQKLFKVPVFFFAVAACLGLFLRYLMIFPVEGVNYTYVLHGHSHVMFLGWVFNVLFIAFVNEFTDGKGFRVIFWILQSLVVSMLISFPLQGYGIFSIIFTTLHTFVAFVFIFLFFRSTRGASSLSVMLAKASLLFFLISSIGPFYLGYLMSSGQGQSDLYRFSIYFYLHFQYNGFFFFGVLSLLVNLMEEKISIKANRRLKLASLLFFVACFPAYCLSLLWAKPGAVFNNSGLMGAILQLAGLLVISRPLLKFWRKRSDEFDPIVKLLFRLAFVSLVVKVILQVISSNTEAALFANEFRSVVIGYLHLVLVGVVTLFLIGWLIHKRMIDHRVGWAVGLFVAGFIVSELSLVALPWLSSEGNMNRMLNVIIFIASVPMVVSVMLFLRACFTVKQTNL